MGELMDGSSLLRLASCIDFKLILEPLLGAVDVVILLQFTVADFAFHLSGSLPGRVGEGDILPLISPVHPDALGLHQLHELLAAPGLLPAVHDGQGDVLDIALGLSGLGLFQQIMGLLRVAGSVLPLGSLEGLALDGDGEALFPAQIVTPGFEVTQICLAPLELMAIFCVDRIDDDVGVFLRLVGMDGNHDLVALPCRGVLSQLDSVGKNLFVGYILFRMVGKGEMLIAAPFLLAPGGFHGLHFHPGGGR